MLVGIVGDLDMVDVLDIVFQCVCQIVVYYLCVVDVVLYFDIVVVDGFQQVKIFGYVVQLIVWYVELVVDWFDYYGGVDGGEVVGGVVQVGDICCFQFGFGKVGGVQVSYVMQLFVIEQYGIIQCLFDVFGKFVLLVWQIGQVVFVGCLVVGCQIEQYLFEIGCLQLGGDVGCLVVVGKEVFDVFEVSGCGVLELFGEWYIGKEKI